MVKPMRKPRTAIRKPILDTDTGIDDALQTGISRPRSTTSRYWASSAHVAADTAVYNTAYGTVRVPERSGIAWFDTSLLGGLVHSRRVARSSMVRMGWADSVRLLAPLPLVGPIPGESDIQSTTNTSMCPIQENRTLE